MLLFNFLINSVIMFGIVFQNISCYCLTNISNGEQTVGRISKHLMLLFNSSQHFHHCKLIQFQNISCYCLTYWNDIAIIIISLFQNISCYCLTKYKKKLKGVKLISKHLMLLFNTEIFDSRRMVLIFQNISCYCLTNEKSLFLNRFFTKKNDFISFFRDCFKFCVNTKN